MPRRFENLQRHNIQLARGDMKWLQRTYPSISAAAMIRTLIELHRQQVKAQQQGNPRP
jgi:hypothetical protein